jgi:hypothetical protein
VIDPGEWTSADPIVFGGESLEAAAREVFNDPIKRFDFIKALSSPEGLSDAFLPDMDVQQGIDEEQPGTENAGADFFLDYEDESSEDKEERESDRLGRDVEVRSVGEHSETSSAARGEIISEAMSKSPRSLVNRPVSPEFFDSIVFNYLPFHKSAVRPWR